MENSNIQNYAIKIAIFPTKEQEKLLLDSCRFYTAAYNYCVSKFEEVSKENKEAEASEKKFFPKGSDIDKIFRKIRFEDEYYSQFNNCAAHISNEAARAYQKALDNFCSYCKAVKSGKGGRKYGPPHFRSYKKRIIKSYTVDGTVKIEGNYIKIPSVRKFPLKLRWRHKGYNLEGVTASQVTISYDGKRFYAAFPVEGEKEIYEKTNQTVGIDLGLKTAVVGSNGEIFDYKMSKSERRRRKRADRRLSRKAPKKGEKPSKNYPKEKERHKRLYLRETNRRKDFQHKMTSNLVKENDTIAAEDLNVSGMLKNHHLARAVSEIGMYTIRTMLDYKSKWHGRKFVTIDRYYPSSQRCSKCGYLDKSMKNLSKRTFNCPHCGNVMDRDLNAAKNIATLGCSESGKWYTTSNACGEFINIGQEPVAQKTSQKRRKKQENTPETASPDNNISETVSFSTDKEASD